MVRKAAVHVIMVNDTPIAVVKGSPLAVESKKVELAEADFKKRENNLVVNGSHITKIEHYNNQFFWHIVGVDLYEED